MGVIVRQKKGATGKGKPWFVFINYKGRRTQRKFTNKEIAEAVELKIRQEMIDGTWGVDQEPKTEAPTFKEYSEKWFDNYVCGQLRASTADEYESILRIHVLPTFGKRSIDSITRGEVRDLLLSKFKGNLSKGRTLLIKDVLSSVFNYALDDELIAANPIAGITKRLFPKDNSKATPITETDVFTEPQIDQLLSACKAHFPDYHMLFLIAAKTGMRLGETLALKWGDVDLKKGVIWVKRSFRRGRITPPKNGKIRKVKMSAPLADALKTELPKAADKLITDYNGSYLPQNQARRIYVQILDKAYLEYRKFHSLRHSYASIMLSKGASPVYVKKQLGHSSIDITVDIYTHWIDDDENDQADLIEMRQSVAYMRSEKIGNSHPLDPEPSASTNSATSARTTTLVYLVRRSRVALNIFFYYACQGHTLVDRK
jgi:integrase